MLGEIGHKIMLHQKLPCDCVGHQEMWFPVVSMKDADLLDFLKFRCSLVSSVCREAGKTMDCSRPLLEAKAIATSYTHEEKPMTS